MFYHFVWAGFGLLPQDSGPPIRSGVEAWGLGLPLVPWPMRFPKSTEESL